MAVKSEDGPTPLYIQTAMRILREMRIAQQKSGIPFSYDMFKELLLNTDLTPSQLAPLQQRLDTLESFMVPRKVHGKRKEGSQGAKEKINDWSPKVVLCNN